MTRTVGPAGLATTPAATTGLGTTLQPVSLEGSFGVMPGMPGWSNPLILSLFAVTAAGLVAFAFIERAARDKTHPEADWASYLLFDGGFARELIEVGRRDAHDKADQVRAFFAETE